MRKKKHLTIEEKRDWLASVFRNADGEYSQADRFKAMVEDTRLAMLQEEKNASAASLPGSPTLTELPPPMD